MKLPSNPQKGKPVAHTIGEIINYMRAITITRCEGGMLRRSPNGTTLTVKASTQSGPRPSFCEILKRSGKSYIVGGTILAGDNPPEAVGFTVPDYEVNLATPGKWLVEIILSGVVAKSNDDGIFLPGIVTATGTPTWNLIPYTAGVNYSDNINPTTTDDTGTIILEVGKLTVAAGEATLDAVSCGKRRVGQCSGVLHFKIA